MSVPPDDTPPVCVNVPQPVTAKAPLEKRDYCLNELLETEANYVSVLEMLRDKFMEPLRSHLGPDHTAAIFQGIQVRRGRLPAEARRVIRGRRLVCRVARDVAIWGGSGPTGRVM